MDSLPIFLSAALSSLITVLIFLLNGLKGKTEKQEERLNNLSENLPIDYVRRDDFVRWSIKIDRRMDDLFKEIQKIREGK